MTFTLTADDASYTHDDLATLRLDARNVSAQPCTLVRQAAAAYGGQCPPTLIYEEPNGGPFGAAKEPITCPAINHVVAPGETYLVTSRQVGFVSDPPGPDGVYSIEAYWRGFGDPGSPDRDIAKTSVYVAGPTPQSTTSTPPASSTSTAPAKSTTTT